MYGLEWYCTYISGHSNDWTHSHSKCSLTSYVSCQVVVCQLQLWASVCGVILTAWCQGKHSTQYMDTWSSVCGHSTGLSLWQSVLLVANVFHVLSSISCCDFPCHVLSIPEYKLVFTVPPSCMAVCSPYLHNAVTFYICTFSAGNSCLILPFCPPWTN